MGEFSPIGRSIYLFLGYFFPRSKLRINFDEKRVRLHFGQLFHKLIWSPCLVGTWTQSLLVHGRGAHSAWWPDWEKFHLLRFVTSSGFFLNYKSSPYLSAIFSTVVIMYWVWLKWIGRLFGETFSKTHLVTLPFGQRSLQIGIDKKRNSSRCSPPHHILVVHRTNNWVRQRTRMTTTRVTWDRCYDFKNIFAKNRRKNGVFVSKQS
jgi:hypothetical protein